jgi:hypothetical protein
MIINTFNLQIIDQLIEMPTLLMSDIMIEVRIAVLYFMYVNFQLMVCHFMSSKNK